MKLDNNFGKLLKNTIINTRSNINSLKEYVAKGKVGLVLIQDLEAAVLRISDIARNCEFFDLHLIFMSLVSGHLYSYHVST